MELMWREHQTRGTRAHIQLPPSSTFLLQQILRIQISHLNKVLPFARTSLHPGGLIWILITAFNHLIHRCYILSIFMVTFSPGLTSEPRRASHSGMWVVLRARVVRVGTEKSCFLQWACASPSAPACLACCTVTYVASRGVDLWDSESERGKTINHTELETFKLNFHLACTRVYLSTQLGMDQIKSDIV